MRPSSRRSAPVTTANQAARLRSGPGTEAAIEVSPLSNTDGPVVAVDDVPFSVADGEIFGILGPNGARKTTTSKCATGPRTPTRTSSGHGPRPSLHRDGLHAIVAASAICFAEGDVF
jgi:ABC-type glutathione transport system ATPase component